MCRQCYNYLVQLPFSLSPEATQVYDALSYYHDHQAKIDGLIEESRPERVIAAQGLKVEKVAEGVAVVHAPP